ncbi:MAG: uroporphyrinogen-III synthase [Simkaniaceae bacterium]|nr:uroporphyrinogen-III synthase [Simkaniaceae bacterium]
MGSHTTLYLGSSPRHFKAKGELFHLPLIKIVPRDFSLFSIKTAIDDLADYTHIIFTSKNAVSIFCDLLKYYDLELSNQKVIAVGEITANALASAGIKVSLIASQETQEGIMHELALLDLDEAYILLPCSARARPALGQYLRNRQLRHKICHLYDTIAQIPEKAPDLASFDTIVFTSPSTIEAFSALYGALPKGKEIVTIGPITSQALASY